MKEKRKQRPETIPGFGAMPTRIEPSRYLPETEEQFIKDVRANPSRLDEYVKRPRKPDVLPESWEEATQQERREMYNQYLKTVKPGGRYKLYDDFAREMEIHPEDIPEYLTK